MTSTDIAIRKAPVYDIYRYIKGGGEKLRRLILKPLRRKKRKKISFVILTIHVVSPIPPMQTINTWIGKEYNTRPKSSHPIRNNTIPTKTEDNPNRKNSVDKASI